MTCAGNAEEPRKTIAIPRRCPHGCPPDYQSYHTSTHLLHRQRVVLPGRDGRVPKRRHQRRREHGRFARRQPQLTVVIQAPCVHMPVGRGRER